MPKHLNWPIAALGLLWWAMETSYFGWNTSPSSIAELFADGAALLFYSAAFAFPPDRPVNRIVLVVTQKGADDGQ